MSRGMSHDAEAIRMFTSSTFIRRAITPFPFYPEDFIFLVLFYSYNLKIVMKLIQTELTLFTQSEGKFLRYPFISSGLWVHFFGIIINSVSFGPVLYMLSSVLSPVKFLLHINSQGGENE